MIKNKLNELERNLCFYIDIFRLPRDFQERYDVLLNETKGNPEFQPLTYRHEAFRQFVNFLVSKLPRPDQEYLQRDMLPEVFLYKNPAELLVDLILLQKTLIKFGAEELAYSGLRETIRIVDTFGFHLAKLDIRQNSQFHELALSQLLDAARLNGDEYLKALPARRLAFINKELCSSRPFTNLSMEPGKEAMTTLEVYKVLSKYIHNNGQEGIGSLIVSMTRNVSDLLTVYLLEREVGLMLDREEGLASRLQVVPLFETIEDLAHSLTGQVSAPWQTLGQFPGYSVGASAVSTLRAGMEWEQL